MRGGKEAGEGLALLLHLSLSQRLALPRKARWGVAVQRRETGVEEIMSGV
jgi:hypothetical protein